MNVKPTYQKYTPPEKVYKSWKRRKHNPIPSEFLFEIQSDPNQSSQEKE